MNQPELVEGELLPVCGAPGCRVVARPAQALCDVHSVQQSVFAAKRKLAEAAPMAAEQLIRLAEHGSSDDVQRRASEAVLDRAGVRPGVEIDVVTADIGGRSPADVLRERIAVVQRRLAGATSASALPDASPTARSWEDLLQLPSSAGPEDADEVE